MDGLVTTALSDPEGVLIEPAEPAGVGVLVLSGSSGRIEHDRARLLATSGATAVSIRWFGGPGQQPQPYGVPLETFTGALDLLATPCRRVVVLGSSFGAEAALLLGTLDARIDAVIAFAPSPVVWAGVEPPDGQDEARQTSHWTLDGSPVPFVPLLPGWAPALDPPAFRDLYERSLAACRASQLEAATIAVERIRGDVVVVGGGDDRVWPGADFAGMIAARRAAYSRETTVVTHPRAGHRVILPSERPASGGQVMARGGSPTFDAELGSLAWPHILRVLGPH